MFFPFSITAIVLFLPAYCTVIASIDTPSSESKPIAIHKHDPTSHLQKDTQMPAGWNGFRFDELPDRGIYPADSVPCKPPGCVPWEKLGKGTVKSSTETTHIFVIN